jgi:predicted nucleotidyltransferase
VDFEEQLDKGVELVRERLDNDGRKLLYLVVSGSHAWGLQRADSDIDLRGVYQDPTMQTFILHKGRDTIEFSEGIYDVQLYEIEKFLRMLCNHNGNMVNLLWLPNPIQVSFIIPWGRLAHDFLTKKLRFYYRGYAESQRKRAMSQRGGKALIYTYREMFSGLYTMRYGRMEHDFQKLWDEAVNNGWYKGELLGKYFPNPAKEVSDEGWRKFYAEWEELCLVLDAEADKSLLSDSYDGINECSELLQTLRLFDLYSRTYPKREPRITRKG